MQTNKVSIRLHLFTSKKYADDTYPIALTQTVNGKRHMVVIHRCLEKDWDKVSKRVKPRSNNAAYINALIAEKYNEAEKQMLAIKQGLKGASQFFNIDKSVTLNEGFDLELVRLEREFKAGFYDKILALKKQIGELGNTKLSNIDKVWFDKMVSQLTNIGNNGTTIKKKIKLVRGVIGHHSEKSIPEEVKKYSVPMNKSIKQKLTEAELGRLENIDLPEGEMLTAARDLFLLQVYLRGIRVGDLLQANSEDFKDGRYIYQADKTGKKLSIKLIPKATIIIDKYKNKHQRLFPFFKWRHDPKQTEFANLQKRLKTKEVCTSVVNKFLKILAVMADIDKPLSSHIARHTFAKMAIDKINNPMITMDLLGHSSLAVHQAYLEDLRMDDVLDKAADDIFS